MELSQLRYFHLLGRLQHVTRAAEELGIAQPTLSRAISKLEAELGVSLFQPSGRSIELSPIGLVYHQFVERALGELDRGRAQIAGLNTARDDTISLGVLRSLATQFVPELIRCYRMFHPAARFVLTEGGIEPLNDSLWAGSVNLCITCVYTEPRGDERFGWHTLARQTFVVIVPPSHRLAARSSVSLSELAQDPFATFKQGYRSRDKIDALLREAGIVPKIISECDESDSLRAIVASGAAVAIVADSGAKSEVVPLAIEDPVALRDVGIMWVPKRELTAAEHKFRTFLIDQSPKAVPTFGAAFPR